MVSCPPLSAGPIRMRDSSPQDVRDTMPDDAALINRDRARDNGLGRHACSFLLLSPLSLLIARRLALAALDAKERIRCRPGLAVDRPAIIPTAARIGGQSRKAVPTESRVIAVYCFNKESGRFAATPIAWNCGDWRVLASNSDDA